MELGLNDFLAELGSSTVSRINRERGVKSIKGTTPVKEEQKLEMPERKVEKRVMMEQVRETEETELNEDFIETALDYAQIVVKTVRKSFDSKAERRKVMESIRSAVDIYLGEYQMPQRTSKITETINVQPAVPGGIKMNDLTGKEIKIEKPKMNDNLNIGVVTGPDGKQHADLSKLDESDIHALKVLSGIVEAEE